MKAKPILKWIGLVSTSVALTLATATAKSDKDGDGKDNDGDKKSHSENPKDKSDKGDQKADRKMEKADTKSDRKVEKADNDPRNGHADTKGDNRDPRADMKGDNRNEHRVDPPNDTRADNRGQRVENREQRVENRERRIYKRGEFQEHIQDRDRDRIVGYFSGFSGREHGLPPELARGWEGGRRLPGGWRDRLVRGYVLDDEWYSAFRPVPYSWFPEVVIVPDTRLYWYGDRVVRVYEPTREVVDVIPVPSVHIDL